MLSLRLHCLRLSSAGTPEEVHMGAAQLSSSDRASSQLQEPFSLFDAPGSQAA